MNEARKWLVHNRRRVGAVTETILELGLGIRGTHPRHDCLATTHEVIGMPSAKHQQEQNANTKAGCGLMMMALVIGLYYMGSGDNSSQAKVIDPSADTVDRPVPPPLPTHRVASNTDLRPKLGRRIAIHVRNPDLTREECRTLVAAYRSEAAPDGQVTVHKPHRAMDNDVMPWCVENFDDRGVWFNDILFR